MTRQNCINFKLPAVVASGGTGLDTITDHGVIVGSGTSPVDALGVGSTGTLLVGATGADPAFGTSADGAFTFTSATAGTDRILTVSNTDNSNAASAATVQLTTGGTSAGDSAVKWSITGGVNCSMGIDNSATGDPLKISNSNALGTTDTWVMTTAGERTMLIQPAFMAYPSTTKANVTGTGSFYTVIWDTEVFDQNSDFTAASGVFTAPVTGRYKFWTNVKALDVTDASFNTTFLDIFTSNNTFQYAFTGKPTTISAAGELTVTHGVLCDMDAGDTAYVGFFVGGTSKIVDVYGGNRESFFGGYLVC